MANDFLDQLFCLEGRTALVTGASSGIGRHMAGVLARAGASVVCVARRADRLQELINELAHMGYQAEAIAADLAGENHWPGLAEAVGEPFGAPHIVVNAAGVNPRKAADRISEEEWRATLHLNLSVPFFLARALVPAMAARGDGRIINIASLQSYRAFTNGMAYGASKGGIVQLTRAMAEAWSGDGIMANAIAPGFFPTELTDAVFSDPALRDHHAGATAVGRNGHLSDLDGITVFLASPASGYVTGQVVAVDGGYLAR